MNRFLAGADSVFSFLKTTVEHRENGCCWRTYDYFDKAHYHYSIFNGVGGIPIFLCEYYRKKKDEVWRTRAEEFGDLALGYKTETADGDRWPTDTEGLYSQDFTYGASGTGYFLLGVFDPLHHSPPLM